VKVSPSFVAGACNGIAWTHILGGFLLMETVATALDIGVMLMAGAWRVCQFRWERKAVAL
jgi:hypothetical protein